MPCVTVFDEMCSRNCVLDVRTGPSFRVMYDIVGCNPQVPKGTTEVDDLERWFPNTAILRCLIDGVAEVNSMIAAKGWDNTNNDRQTGLWHLVRGDEAVVQRKVVYVPVNHHLYHPVYMYRETRHSTQCHWFEFVGHCGISSGYCL
jgi:hypothetical protein